MRVFVAASLVGCLLASQPGCTLSSLLKRKSPQLDTTLLEAQGYSIPRGGMPTPVSSEGAEVPSVILEVRGDEDQQKIKRIPIPTDQGVFIEDIVAKGRLSEVLGNLSISIMRPTAHGEPPIRLDLRTDDKGRATNIGSNYALRPGDHIIVNADQRSYLERFISSQMKL